MDSYVDKQYKTFIFNLSIFNSNLKKNPMLNVLYPSCTNVQFSLTLESSLPWYSLPLDSIIVRLYHRLYQEFENRPNMLTVDVDYVYDSTL